MANLKLKYQQEVSVKLLEEFEYKNKHQIPKLEKIQISMGLGLKAQNKKYLEKAINEIRLITGQHPLLTKAKKSVAGFKIREGMPLGLVVTLRREKMYDFFEKLIKLVLPRIKDFRGLSVKSFDKRGSYSFGISDQLVFPELNYDDVEEKRGFNITIVTTSNTETETYFLLKHLGFPFAEEKK